MSLSVLLMGVVALPAVVGFGLMYSSIAMTAAFGWKRTMAAREDGRWPLARMLMAAGAGLMLFSVAGAAALWLVPIG